MTHSGFNPYVHGARGLFAAQILVFHLLGADWPFYPAAWSPGGRLLTRIMEYGVELFFCVSGYVMVQALARAPGPWSFLRDRAVRIMPLLWINVAASLVLGMLSSTRSIWSLPAPEIAALGVANMLALPGIFPIATFNPATWSLSYEMLFYALCALWLGAGGKGRAALGLAAIALLLFYPRALPFVIGLLVGLDRGGGKGGLTARPGLAVGLFLVAWATIQALSADGTLLIDTTLLDWLGDPRVVLAAVALVCLRFGFQGLVDGAGRFGRFLISRPMQFLGTISYSFYLWQNAAIGAARRILRWLVVDDPTHPLVMAAFPVLATAILLLIAIASHRLIEVRLTRWLRAKLGGAATPPITPAAPPAASPPPAPASP